MVDKSRHHLICIDKTQHQNSYDSLQREVSNKQSQREKLKRDLQG